MSRCVAAVAVRLHDRLGEVASHIRRSLERTIPELGGDLRIEELLGTSIEANVDTMLHALRYDIAVERVEAPTTALEYARRLAQHGVPVNALVRAYRLGQRLMNELIFDELRATDIPESMRVPVIEAISVAMFEYIDWMSQQVVVYEDERERWLENQNSLRGVRVRETLAADKEIDADAAITSVRHPLRWHHPALVMWYPDQGSEVDELPRLQRFLRELGEAPESTPARCSWPLTRAADGGGCRTGRRRSAPWRRSLTSYGLARIHRTWRSEHRPVGWTAFADRTGRRPKLAALGSCAIAARR